MRLISFTSTFSDEVLKKTLHNIKSIILYNKELEEKEILLQVKIDELKKLFEIKHLTELQNLNFETKQSLKPVKLDGAEEFTKPAGPDGD